MGSSTRTSSKNKLKMNEIKWWENIFSNEILPKQVIRVKMCYLHT
jgi:hypothetical protein